METDLILTGYRFYPKCRSSLVWGVSASSRDRPNPILYPESLTFEGLYGRWTSLK